MNHGPIEYLTDISNFSREFLHDFRTISSKTQQKLADLQFNFLSEQLENTRKQFMSYTPITNQREWLAGVSDLTGQYGDEALGLTRKISSVLAAYREEVIALMDKGLISTGKVEKISAKRSRKRS